MAYTKPIDLDGFITLMTKCDIRIRAQLAEDLVNFLSDSENSLYCTDLGLLIDALIPFLTGSHFKIAKLALEAFTELVQRLGQDFNAYTSTILPHVVDRLGDGHDTVREKAQLLLQKLVECRVLTAQSLLDKLVGCFKHKNAKVREEYLQTIVTTLNEYGTQSVAVKSFVSPIVVLLGDPSAVVREAAQQTLIEIYKHVGDRLRHDLLKKEVPPGKLAQLEQKFDEVKSDGLLLPSALNSGNQNYDEADTASLGPPVRPTKLVKRTMSATASARKPGINELLSGSGENMTTQAGAVSQEIFEASFENVPQVTIFGQREIDELMKTINNIIGDKNMDWEKRVDALKKLRSLLMQDAQSYPNFPQQLKDLSIAFLDILKELRSQVIREACITLAYMCKILRTKLDQFLTYILQELINLIQNSAKVISSSGIITLKYVIRYSHIPKLLPIITQNLMQSKSKDIRSCLCEILCMVFEEWQTKALERHVTLLKDALKKGISDADAEARRHSRRSYWNFRKHFPAEADQLFGSLDIATQRQVEKERDAGSNGTSMSASLRGSNTSLNSMPGGVLTNAAANYRSISAVDANAAQRARARAQYANLSRLKMTPGSAAVPRAKKVIPNVAATPTQPSPERQMRSRQAGVSQSTPSSRSTSPSNRLHYGTYTGGYRQTGTVPKKTTGIPRSLANSRETSPSRSGGDKFGSLNRRQIYSNNTGSPRRAERPPLNPGRTPYSAQKILQQSREAESALADALSPDDPDLARLTLGHRKISREESDDGSEASSQCSDRSFDSYRRGNDSFSWNGSKTRLDSSTQYIDNIETIIQYCASSHWNERKDGLTNLAQWLSEGKMLTPQQLQCVLDLFRKMFMDPHIKVYSLFLDAVNELILTQSQDLHDWLFILLTRLFNKLGTDLLNSMNAKIWKTLSLIYEYFPTNLQMQSVFKILTDATQIPNAKTKTATLKFLTTLAQTYCRAEDNAFVVTPPADKAILKILQYSQDQKSLDLRTQAKYCIIALYNCNTANMTLLLSSMPKQYQDTAKNFIQQALRKSTADFSGTNSPSSPISASSPKLLLSPQQYVQYSSLQNHVPSPRSRQTSVEVDHPPISHEEVYKNLRKTTAEIQNYSFESKLDRDANSKDSGISQMGGDHHLHAPANGFNGHAGSIDRDDSVNGSKTQSATTTESNTPENTIRMEAMGAKVSSVNYTIENNEVVLERGLREPEVIKQILGLAQADHSDPEYIMQVMLNLNTCIRYGNCELPIKHFKQIMIALLKLIESQNSVVMVAALQTLSKIIRSPPMRACWTNFLELIILKIIDSYKSGKEVQREIDIIITKIAAVLPVDASINILNPVIATGEFPSNLCALKILRDLADQQGKDFTDNHLDILMPNIARLADVEESMVRKAAVFCIVKLYFVLGEEKVKPKFALLNASKVRLLNVYISKSQGKS